MPIPRPDTDVAKQGATVVAPGNRRARRRMFRMLRFGAVEGIAPICSDTSDPDTILCGFSQRLLRKVPDPKPALMSELKAFVADWLRLHMPMARSMTFEDWLARTSYNEARKTELRIAHLELRGGAPTRWQARRIKSFVKTESYNEYKHCRMINSRSDHFKVFSGPLFKAIEDVVYALPEFIKHVPVPERPLLMMQLRKSGRRYYSTDFTAFESHFTAEVMDAIELQLYEHCLSWCPDACKVIRTALAGANHMSTRSGIKAVVQARRMSGDMCTSLGNGFSNLMLAKFIAFKQGKEIFGFVEGDDGIFATDAVLTKESYSDLGFTIKIKEVADPCEASFCGMVFAGSGQIVRDPVAFLSTFGWTSSFINAGERIMDELLRAKSLSAVYETPQCPIIGVLAREALRRTRHVNPRWVEDGYHDHTKIPRDEFALPPFAPSADTRELVSRLYGIDVKTQLYVENQIRKGEMNFASSLPVHPHYGHFAARYVEVG